MLSSSGARGYADGIYEDFQFFLVFQLFQKFPFAVQIVVQDHILIVLFQLGIQSIRILYFLAGGAVICKPRILISEIILQYRRKNNNLIHPVICTIHAEITIGILHFLRCYNGARVGISDGYPRIVYGLDDSFYKSCIALIIV